MSTTPHTPAPEPTTPTQTAHPWRAAVRTFVQTWVPFVLLIVLALPEVMPLLDDELGQYLPDHVRGWLLGIGTFAAALAALATRLMALQSVTRVLERFRALGWLAPTPPRR
ncbi:hypothetical protein [Serinicoccus sediminis]|uniref:hypothetical protein n=1 Tax=Serinicoccus sediminis TaxID=2306021 RepID=UPI001022117A|nr:hypothetical protein [Serinicoccus sediminis]